MNQHSQNQLLRQKERLEASITASCRAAEEAESFLLSLSQGASQTGTDTSFSELIRQYIFTQNRAGHALIAEYNQILGKLGRV